MHLGLTKYYQRRIWVHYDNLTCCPSEFWMCSSPSFLQASDQFPMVIRVCPTVERIGWLGVPDFTWLRTLWSFSINSLRFSVKWKQFLQLEHTIMPRTLRNFMKYVTSNIQHWIWDTTTAIITVITYIITFSMLQ